MSPTKVCGCENIFETKNIWSTINKVCTIISDAGYSMCAGLKQLLMLSWIANYVPIAIYQIKIR